MPVTFDDTSGGGRVFNASVDGVGPLSYTENGIDLNMSITSLDGSARLTLANGNFIFMNDLGADDVFTLDFNGGVIVGNATTPISFQYGTTYANNGWSIRFVDGINGTATTTVTPNAVPNGSTPGVTGSFTSIEFFSTNGGTGVFVEFASLIAASATCFLTDTLIETPSGKTAVQDLQVGGRLVTADGRNIGIRWIGKQRISGLINRPQSINPICITRGALSEGVPSRDLFVSPDHAIAIDGVLYNAGALVNGDTIYQTAWDPSEPIVYYHIETDAHELVLAEDCPAESYIDYNNPYEFENADERDMSRVVAEMDMPRVSSARQVPSAMRNRIANARARTVAA